MARMRSLKPEFWTDEELASRLSRDTRLLYLGLWNLADEHARLRGNPRYVKGQLFPYDDDLGIGDVDAMLNALAAEGKLVRYRVRGQQYVFLPNLARHQRLEAEKVPSRLPGPDEAEPEQDASESRADKFAPRADEPERRADELSLKHVAGSREHVPPTVPRKERGADNGQPLTVTQRAKPITDAYAEAQPMCRWPAINGVVLHALKAGKYADDEIRDALLRMAKSGQTVTVESLRVELEGLAPRASPRRQAEEAHRQRALERAQAREKP